MMIRRPLTTLCSIVASCAILAAQGQGQGQGTAAPPPPAGTPAQGQQPPTFRLRVDSVSVDVTVTDKQGLPVTDLKQGDFEIREAGKVQTIENFRLVEIPENEPVGAEPVRNILSEGDMARATADPGNRLFIIILDDYHTRVGNSISVRQKLSAFVSQLTSRDLVALLYPIQSVLAATFSRNHEETANAVMQFVGRKYVYDPKNDYEFAYSNLPPEQQEQIRNELVFATLKSTCALMNTLREGRKTILLVSEGFAANIPLGARTAGSQFPTRPTNLTPAQQQNLAQQQLSQEFFNTADLQGRMRDIFTVCTRGNTSIYALDPKGLATSEFGAADNVGQDADRRVLIEATDSLRTLADETGGKAITGTNNPVPDLKKMVHELSAYYLLGYTSSIGAHDGKFHEIQVKVNRPGIEVHARKGYWAYSEEELKRAYAPPKAGPAAEVADALDELTMVVDPTSRHTVSLWLGAVRGEAGNAQVTLVWEAAAGRPDTAADRVATVTITATSGNGDVVFRGPVPRDPTAFSPTGKVTFPSAAGPLRVKVAVENARGQRLDNEDVSDTVPDFTGTGAMITAPQVFRARTAFQVGLLRTSTTAIPAVGRQFSRTERLFLRFEAYGPAGITPKVTLRILNRMGEPLSSMAPPAVTSPSGSTFESDVSLAGLLPGDYIIEIAATAGPERTVRLMGIRVTG